MWLLKWWTRGRQLTLMPVSGRQELQPCSQIQPCPSVWAAFHGLTGCHWVFKGCLLGWELLHPGFSKGRERCIKKAFMGQLFGWEWEHHGICETHNPHSLHLSGSWVSVSWICLFCCWSCLLHILVCVFISSLCDLFSLCLSLHTLPPTLPWCSACCSIKAAKMKNASSDVHIGAFKISLFGFSFLFCLMLVSGKYGWKEKKGMLEHLCPGGCRQPWAHMQWMLKLCLHPGRQVPVLCSTLYGHRGHP